MQGTGNDFVMIDGYSSPIVLTTAQIKKIANRHFGVGCDQLLLVEKTDLPNADFKYRIFNSDGAEVEQCGNGARCFVRFVRHIGLTKKHEIVVETASGLIVLTVRDDNQVTVNMGEPKFNPHEIPFEAKNREKLYTLQIKSKTACSDGHQSALIETTTQVAALDIQIAVLSMGNPHAVTIVDDVDTANVAVLGPLIESHARFAKRANAGFMQVINAHEIKLRVYERGAGETLACGTGACAAVVSGIALEHLKSPVLVNMRGGQLNIEWKNVSKGNGEGEPVLMTGPAEIVFEGSIEIDIKT